MKSPKLPVLLLLLIAANSLFAQNLSGTWIGSATELPHGVVPPQKFVIEITVYNDSLITGASHYYYIKGRFEHHKMSGKINRQDGTVVLTEDSIMGKKVGPFVSVRKGIYNLKLSVSDARSVMKGTWKDKGLIGSTKIDVQLLKKTDPPIVKSSNAANVNTLPPVATRISDLQHLFEVDRDNSDSIKVEVVDNGVVDGDTVSIYFDNHVIAQNLGISEKPFSFYFSLDPREPLQRIKMVAENMGSIPPNTALFIITIGRKKHKIYLSSDMQKNATVEFFLK